MNLGRYRFGLPLDLNATDTGFKRRHVIGDVQISESAVDQ